MKLWAELKRRNVVRVAAAYAALAWLLTQVSVNLESAVGLPEWFDGMVVSLLVLGFPVVVLAAWAFEKTPEGLRRTQPAPQAPSGRLAPADMASIALLALVAAAVAYQIVDDRREAAAPAIAAAGASAPAAPAAAAAADPDGRRSIAVLPFVNMSSDPEQEYFSDGLSEELLNRLARITALRVTARTSSFAFKGRNADLREIGAALGVANVLEGSVRRSGDTLRITAQLIDVADGSHLWSETYDRQITDVFVVQDEIAMAVAQQLSVTLGLVGVGESNAGTDSVEAYDAYLRGRELALREVTSTAQLEEALVHLRRAVALDPQFALAWADMLLPMGLLAQGATTPEAQAQVLAEMERAAQRAAAIAPDLWQTQAALGQVEMTRQDWIAADRAFARARDLAGGRGETMGRLYWSFLLQMGRAREALSVLEAVMRIDPFDRTQTDGVDNVRYLLGDADRLAPRDTAPTMNLRVDRALARDGDAEIIALLETSSPILAAPDGVEAPAAAMLRILRLPEGERLEALRRLDPTPYGRTPLVAFAGLAERLGDRELAAGLLRRAYVDINAASAYWLIWGRSLERTRQTPEFRQMLRDLGFVDFWRATGNWGDFCRPVGADDFECA